MKKLLAALGAGALLISLTGCGTPPPPPFLLFQKAYDTCGTPSGVTVSDEGTTITIDGNGDYQSYGADIYDIACVLSEVNTPTYIISNMDTTNSLMGRQTASFDGIDVSWSYHPDNGLDIVLHKRTEE